MKTAVEELIHFIKNDRMQSTYTKEQILELLEFKLEKEKEQIIEAHRMSSVESGFEHSAEDWANRYYNETYKNK
jgi:hypothetical protein